MGKVITGIKAGAVSGAIYGVIMALIEYLRLILFKEDIVSAIIAGLPSGFSITREEAYNIALLTLPILLFIMIIPGVIFGIIYGWAYDKIPGRTSIIKGIVIGLILWLIFDVVPGLGNLSYSVTYFLYSLGVGLIASLISGAFLGFFYNRFTPKTVS